MGERNNIEDQIIALAGGRLPEGAAVERIEDRIIALVRGGGASEPVAPPPPADGSTPSGLSPSDVQQISGLVEGAPITGERPPPVLNRGEFQPDRDLMLEQRQQQQFASAFPGAEALRQAVSPDVLGATGGEAAGRVAGVAAGGLIGGPVGAAIGGVAGGAIGAGAGLITSRFARGERVTPGEVALEAGFSAVPDLAIAGVRQGIRGAQRVLSRTRAGRAASEQAGGQLLRETAERALDPPVRQDVSNMFEMVSRLGDQLSGQSIQGGLRNLSDTQFDTVQRELRRVAAPPNKNIPAFGESAAKVMQSIREGGVVRGLDLGALQHLRSQVQKAAMARKEGATKDALNLFIDTIDDGIENGRFLRGGENTELLKAARRGWRVLKQTEDLGAQARRFAKVGKDNKSMTLNLGGLSESLANPTTRLDNKVADALRTNPEAKAQFEQYLRNMETVNISSSTAIDSVPVLNGIAAILGAGPASRARFNRIVNGSPDRTITINQISLLLNALRRGGTEGMSTNEGTSPQQQLALGFRP